MSHVKHLLDVGSLTNLGLWRALSWVKGALGPAWPGALIDIWRAPVPQPDGREMPWIVAPHFVQNKKILDAVYTVLYSSA